MILSTIHIASKRSVNRMASWIARCGRDADFRVNRTTTTMLTDRMKFHNGFIDRNRYLSGRRKTPNFTLGASAGWVCDSEDRHQSEYLTLGAFRASHFNSLPDSRQAAERIFGIEMAAFSPAPLTNFACPRAFYFPYLGRYDGKPNRPEANFACPSFLEFPSR